MLIMNEKIKASEVKLTGLSGEDLGIVSRDDALALARKLKADLVCTSLFSSPPPCKLIAKGMSKQAAIQGMQIEDQKQYSQAQSVALKVKELRLTAYIEEHDYDTKRRQAEKLLKSGNAVQLVVKIQGKEGAQAKVLIQRLVEDLALSGKKETGIQLSGKQAAVKLNPL
jgi:translation initiation factor IF-3